MLRMRAFQSLSAIVVLTGVIPSISAAGETNAVTDIRLVDEDFAFQGEFEGAASVWPQCGPTAGLQVVARGDSQFQAVLYPGGLPGAGWWNGSRYRLNGKRKGSRVELTGDAFHVAIENGVATLSGADRSPIGQLSRIERVSPTLGDAAPYGADVLFDGSSTDAFEKARLSEDGWLMVGTQLKQQYGNYHLHVEFRLPYMPAARGQGRANSGVYLQSSYEIQILDSFGLEGTDNECGALYKSRPPDVNMCFRPLAWQTYDIRFQPPKFDRRGCKRRHAQLTVWHNGVAIHDQICVTDKTGAGAQEGPELLPIKLQNHGNPVHFRNLWIVEYADRPGRPLLAGFNGAFRFDECHARSGDGLLRAVFAPLRSRENFRN